MPSSSEVSKPYKWEDLQKKARLLENEIDLKLLSLNKINSFSGLQVGQDQNNYGKKTIFDTLTAELESQLSKLSGTIDEMREFVDSGSFDIAKNSSIVHMFRRHNDLLTDYSAEFSRASSNIRSQIEREELFDDTNSKDTDLLISNRVNTRSNEYLLRENDSIRNCDRLLDEQISIAISVKENVSSQSSGLGNVNRRLHQFTKKYPAINNLMQKIRMKKRKDTVVLAAVISTCLILFFLFAMR